MNIPHDWTFKTADVAGEFDKHVREQLPWYDLVTGAIAHFARHYIPHGGRVYDIGASTGNIGKALADVIADRSVEFIALDNSAEMQSRYTGPGTFLLGDATEFEFEPFDLSILFLSMMFMPVIKRGPWLLKLAAKVRKGGAVLIFDKCLPRVGYLSIVLSRLALAGKTAAGVPAAEIIAKELSLGGIQRPICESELPLGCVEIFRFGDFAGWICEAK